MTSSLPTRSEISLTLKYSAFFKSRLTLKQLHHWLISPHTHTLSQIRKSLTRFPQLKKQLISSSPSSQQKKLFQQKLSSIRPFLTLLKFFPTIRFVGLTGSLAILNTTPEDDIDFLIITSPHTLWLTRLFLFPFLLFFNHRRPKKAHRPNDLCLNLWLDQSNLTLLPSKQNLYTAHELLQMKPLLDRGQTYSKLLLSNSWASHHLANAYHQQTSSSPLSKNILNTFSSVFFTFLSILLFPLNLFSYFLQRFYMSSKITTETVTLSQVYFHPQDFFSPLHSHLYPFSKIG